MRTFAAILTLVGLASFIYGMDTSGHPMAIVCGMVLAVLGIAIWRNPRFHSVTDAMKDRAHSLGLPGLDRAGLEQAIDKDLSSFAGPHS